MIPATCSRCEEQFDASKDKYCFIDNEGWCRNEIVCEHCRERAYDAHQERLMEGGGGPSLDEQHRAAWEEKRRLRR